MVTRVARRLLSRFAARALCARRSGGRMGIAANAVADLAGTPPPPRAAANAGDDDASASFQDHVDANDRPAPREERARPKSEARPQTPQSQSSDQSEVTTAPAEPAQAEEQHVETKPDAVQSPVFLQLIANAIASTIGPKAAPTPAVQQQEAPASAPAEQAAAQVSSAPATALVSTAAPIKTAPKADASAARPAQAKTAKGATEKTEAAPATVAANAVAEVAAPAPQEQNATPITLAANLAAQDTVKSGGDAKPETVEGVQAAPAHAAPPQQPHRASPTAPPLPAPKTQPQANSSDAKPRDDSKTLPPADALKQAKQDFAPATPKTLAAPMTQPAAVSAHPQLASPVAQAATTATDARTQTAPVAAQVGGEIIRRFNGQDTSFQLRLDPPDLGRVDVRLDVSRDHRVTAVISADNPQALSDLARGVRDLQQALQSAGLDLADDGLRFDLSSNGQGNSFAQAQAQQEQSNFRAANTALAEPSIAPEITASRPLSIDSWRGARVDVMA